MNRILIYLVLAGMAVVVQSALLSQLLPGGFKPDLLLILVIYFGLHERTWRGACLVYSLGWAFDVFAGSFPGLHGFVLLAIFLAVRAVVSRVNAESSLLLMGLVLLGSLLQGCLTIFALEFFVAEGNFWPMILGPLPFQVILNMLAAFLLLKLALWFQLTFLPRRYVPGLRKLDSHHES
ncbi:MAG: rod shape-determining protein MreD [Desulfuromonadales bacterium]|nr:rod shape-determining protein MreD [Desulfuromonadales bacterium]